MCDKLKSESDQFPVEEEDGRPGEESKEQLVFRVKVPMLERHCSERLMMSNQRRKFLPSSSSSTAATAALHKYSPGNLSSLLSSLPPPPSSTLPGSMATSTILGMLPRARLPTTQVSSSELLSQQDEEQQMVKWLRMFFPRLPALTITRIVLPSISKREEVKPSVMLVKTSQEFVDRLFFVASGECELMARSEVCG